MSAISNKIAHEKWVSQRRTLMVKECAANAKQQLIDPTKYRILFEFRGQLLYELVDLPFRNFKRFNWI